MPAKNIRISDVVRIAGRLDALGSRFAFVGGTVVQLLVDNPRTIEFRPTDDVDVVVQVATRLEYSMLEEKLTDLDFGHEHYCFGHLIIDGITMYCVCSGSQFIN